MASLDDYPDYDDELTTKRRKKTAAKVEVMTQELLQEILYYDPATGEFTLNEVPGERSGGRETGCKLNNHTGIVILRGKQYPLHRLAFLYMVGKIPPYVIFKNRNRGDLRWENLEAQDTKAKPPKPGRSFGTFGLHKVNCLKCGYLWSTHFNAPRHWIRCDSCQNVLRYDDIKLD